MITTVWSMYCQLSSIISTYIAFAQIDLCLVRLVVNHGACTTAAVCAAAAASAKAAVFGRIWFSTTGQSDGV